jgi:two-component system sensor histidine kinase EvgS
MATVTGKKGVAVIAEDSAPNAAALSIFVRQSGLDVVQFVDGKATWDYMQGLPEAELANVRIIFSDFMMPRMNGFELLQKVKAHPLMKRVPFVFCSAVVDPKLARDAVKLSDGYLVKPATLKQVQKKIESLIGPVPLQKPDKAG